MKYEVLWKKLWKKQTKFGSLAISVPVAFVFVARFIENDMNLDVTFEHISISQLPLIFLGIVVCSAFIAFIISFSFKFAAIEITDGQLKGRNYWYSKNSIPIASIKELYPFNDSGIEAVVADAGVHGKVYILTQTERLDEIIDYLENEIDKIDL